MNSHFQSRDTAWTLTGLRLEFRGRAGSRSCDPIQMTPPRNKMTTIASMMASALRRIVRLAAPTGPCGSRMPDWQPDSALADAITARWIAARRTRHQVSSVEVQDIGPGAPNGAISLP